MYVLKNVWRDKDVWREIVQVTLVMGVFIQLSWAQSFAQHIDEDQCNLVIHEVDSQLIAGQLIHEITIQQGPIFEPPFEGIFAPLYEWANRFHSTTGQTVLQEDLLFEKGDDFDSQVAAATERRLRSRQYLNGAEITATQVCDLKNDVTDINEGVHVNVKVKEVWTLEPQFSFSQTGDELTYNVGIQETNVLGSGKTIAASQYSNASRQGYLLYYADPHIGFFNSELKMSYANNDDGGSQSLSLVNPFASLASPWSAGVQFFNFAQNDTVYDAGSQVDVYAVSHQSMSIFYGFPLNKHVYDLGELNVTRLIFGYSHINQKYDALTKTDSTELIPQPFLMKYPWIELHYIQHRFQQKVNISSMNQIEDINFGRVLASRFGYVFSPQKTLDQAVFLSFSYRQFFELSQTQLLGVRGQIKSFIDADHMSNLVDTQMGIDLRYYWNPQVFKNKAQFFVRLHESRVIDPLNNEYIEIGANSGARGYPARYQSGDRRQTVTLEQRYFGAREWFSLVYIGGAVFYDASHTWGAAAVPPSEQGWLHSVGVGLRMSSHRVSGAEGGGHSTLHLDIAGPVGHARPVDTTQLLITLKKSF